MVSEQRSDILFGSNCETIEGMVLVYISTQKQVLSLQSVGVNILLALIVLGMTLLVLYRCCSANPTKAMDLGKP